MREISYIAVHCTAGKPTQDTASIKQYWAKVLGWHSYGYHFLVSADGTVENLTPIEQPSNGVKGYNHNSIHICYKGGWDGTDTRTPKQKEALLRTIRYLKARFPQAKIQGHRDFSPDLNHDGKITPNEWVKLCPCFDAAKEYANL